MTGSEVLDVARDAITTLVLVSAPLMLVGLIVGVAISLFQALTQIQEMTLVFVPKILAIFITMLIMLPFMGATMGAYFGRIAEPVPTETNVNVCIRCGSACPLSVLHQQALVKYVFAIVAVYRCPTCGATNPFCV